MLRPGRAEVDFLHSASVVLRARMWPPCRNAATEIFTRHRGKCLKFFFFPSVFSVLFVFLFHADYSLAWSVCLSPALWIKNISKPAFHNVLFMDAPWTERVSVQHVNDVVWKTSGDSVNSIPLWISWSKTSLTPRRQIQHQLNHTI